jgi:spore cortex biosynthesis protein YabQ
MGVVMLILEQALVFLGVVFWGGLVGIIWDFLRTLRKVYSFRKWQINLSDVLFWFLITIFTALFLVLLTWGAVRFYFLLGMFLGFSLYLKFCGRFIRRFFLKTLLYLFPPKKTTRPPQNSA